MKKILALTLCTLFLLFALVGCGAAGEVPFSKDAAAELLPEEYGYSGGGYEFYGNEMPAAAEGVRQTDPSGGVSANRKLIRTMSLSLETEEYDVLLAGISERIAACGGYVESMSADTRYSSDSRYATMTVRVPADRLEEFVTSVSGISNVVQRSENTEDVTLSYVDLESHANALRTEQERLIALLEQAENLSEILEIEDRLTYVRYELESMESQLRTYDNLVDYATVTLSVNEVRKLTPTVEKGFWEKIGDGFTDSVNNVWEGLKGLFSFLIVALPYLAVIAVFVLLILAIILLCVRKSRKKAAKRAALKPQPVPPQTMMQPTPTQQQPIGQPVDPAQKNG